MAKHETKMLNKWHRTVDLQISREEEKDIYGIIYVYLFQTQGPKPPSRWEPLELSLPTFEERHGILSRFTSAAGGCS